MYTALELMLPFAQGCTCTALGLAISNIDSMLSEKGVITDMFTGEAKPQGCC